MFRGGSICKPPLINFYTQGMPEKLLVDLDGFDYNKGNLSAAQRDRLGRRLGDLLHRARRRGRGDLRVVRRVTVEQRNHVQAEDRPHLPDLGHCTAAVSRYRT
uniref:(northern house mosquito) hypothetical protein n=1 Tax=Culex pipiens TaxID=7175 RepID=A0A8D8GMI0_CULPI